MSVLAFCLRWSVSKSRISLVSPSHQSNGSCGALEAKDMTACVLPTFKRIWAFTVAGKRHPLISLIAPASTCVEAGAIRNEQELCARIELR
jgi:hypothetical protein